MKTRIFIMLLILNVGILPNSFAEVTSGNAPATTNSLNTALPDSVFNQHGYFTFRQDLRLCPSPLCGGIFVKAVNLKLTRCADGSLQAECHIALVNNKNNIDINSAALLHGRIKTKIFGDFGNLGVFELKEAFSSATAAAGEGRFVGLENNGIICFTSPCFSIDQFLLNRNKLRAISGIDLEEVGASKKNLNKALDILDYGGVLLASGVNKQVDEVAGTGITFVANQFYLPIKPGVQ